MLIDHWPLLGLRLVTPRLELRLPASEELADLADLAAEGMHDPERRPFLVSFKPTASHKSIPGTPSAVGVRVWRPVVRVVSVVLVVPAGLAPLTTAM